MTESATGADTAADPSGSARGDRQDRGATMSATANTTVRVRVSVTGERTVGDRGERRASVLTVTGGQKSRGLGGRVAVVGAKRASRTATRRVVCIRYVPGPFEKPNFLHLAGEMYLFFFTSTFFFF